MEFNLNKEQLDAVLNGDGPTIVVAGAGSGKTRVLTYRVAYLLEEMKVSPYNILAITFTNKAANEMKERILKMSEHSDGIWVCTFHSMCARILRQDISLLGYDKNFSIYSEQETEKVIKRIINEMGIEDNNVKQEARGQISYAKEKVFTPEQYRKNAIGYEIYAEIYSKYEEELKKSNALDFDDLLIKTVELLVKFPEVLNKYQFRFKYVLIDEFQDTNRIQYMLIKLLGGFHKNVFAVGDEDQSIYGWRGADIKNIADFKKDFVGVKIFKLEQNYRSTGNIITCANKLIDNNFTRIKKTLWTNRGEGTKVEYKCLYNDRDEANYVINSIAILMRGGYKYSDFAILVRANSLTRLFEEGLNLYGYPYKVFGGFKFYERKEVKDVIAYLRLITNPRDNEAILRIINFPKRGIGDKAIQALADYSEKHNETLIDTILNIDKNTEITTANINKLVLFKDLLVKLINASNEMKLNDFIDYVITEVGFNKTYNVSDDDDRDRINNIDELISAIKQFTKDNNDASLSLYLQSVSLMSDVDNMGNGDYITIATIHSSKGLEFKAVFMVGLEEGIFPSSMCSDSEKDIEEERRVMYVGTTRAQDRLHLTSARTRFRFNEVQNYLPSRFLKEMGFEANIYREDRSRYQTTSHSALSSPKKSVLDNYSAAIIKPKAEKDISKYKTGVTVVHNRFGEGLIIEMKGNNVAAIAFNGLGVREFNLDIAPIELKGD